MTVIYSLDRVIYKRFFVLSAFAYKYIHYSLFLYLPHPVYEAPSRTLTYACVCITYYMHTSVVYEHTNPDSGFLNILYWYITRFII